VIFQHKDGELRLSDHGYGGGVTNYIEILFTDAEVFWMHKLTMSKKVMLAGWSL
jgi:hypothetical protein